MEEWVPPLPVGIVIGRPRPSGLLSRVGRQMAGGPVMVGRVHYDPNSLPLWEERVWSPVRGPEGGRFRARGTCRYLEPFR